MKKITPKKKTSGIVTEGLGRLIESDLERAELVLAAQAITDKLQKMAEDVAKIEADDVMPILDSLKTAFGPQASERFSQVASEKVRSVMEILKSAKDAIGTEIDHFENSVNGEGNNDMAFAADDSSLDTPSDDDFGAELASPETGDAEPKVDGPAFPEDDEVVGAGANFAGRVKKEGARRRGRRLMEDSNGNPQLGAALMSLDAVDPNMANLARTIEGQIDALEKLPERKALENVLLRVADMGAGAGNACEDTPTEIVDSIVEDMGIEHRVPAVKTVINHIKKLAHMICFHHEATLDETAPIVDDFDFDDELGLDLDTGIVGDGTDELSTLGVDPFRFSRRDPMEPAIVESRAVKALRESTDPDAMILAVFRRVLKESAFGPAACAQHCAKTFGIDFDDVVSIVREAKAAKKKGKVPPQFLANIKKKKGVKEDAAPAVAQPARKPIKQNPFQKPVNKDALVAKKPEPTKTGPGISNVVPKTSEKPEFAFEPNRGKGLPPAAAVDKALKTGPKLPVAAQPKATKTDAPAGAVTLMSKQAERGTKNESRITSKK